MRGMGRAVRHGARPRPPTMAPPVARSIALSGPGGGGVPDHVPRSIALSAPTEVRGRVPPPLLRPPRPASAVTSARPPPRAPPPHRPPHRLPPRPRPAASPPHASQSLPPLGAGPGLAGHLAAAGRRRAEVSGDRASQAGEAGELILDSPAGGGRLFDESLSKS